MASKRLSQTALRPLLTSTPRTTLPTTALPSARRAISAYGYEQAKALTFTQYGDPPAVLSLHTHSISPAHSNLLTLRFLASPINPADINQIQGVYPSKPTFTTALSTPSPIAVAGNEGVAEVISVGDKVKGFARGDWVIMKAPSFGTWRTHAQTTADALVRLENRDGITAVQAGTVSINPCTAYRMLSDFVKVGEGEWFVQNGANSGVGRAAIQLGRSWGLKSINVVRDRPEGVEELKRELQELGATVVVTEKELMAREFRERVKEWTNGGREEVRLGLNCVGGEAATAMAKILAPHAHFVTYGAMSKKPLMLPASLLIFKDIHFDGFWVSKWAEWHPEEKKKTVDHVLELTRRGEFKDMPFEQVPWEWETPESKLIGAVKGTLEGFRKGKGVFVFKNT
ncbi:NAD(P)-binding protein [Lophium mytilinum]|uniref:enoyl-[acyl-carrier-protein] reductase n=1 Tax=Lophium mytilinum TaxID=390894 RepID=A0A6A6R8J7_9PEZI|nr:NAD(P)-binding protein [Lophium mytilinum]